MTASSEACHLSNILLPAVSDFYAGHENYLRVSFNLQVKDILHTTIMPPKGRKCCNNFISVSTMRERDWKENKKKT